MTRLVAPTAFKGTRSPLQAALWLARPGDRLLPLSDGGDGFLECLHHGLGGEFQFLPAEDPFGQSRPVPVLLLPGGIVAVECAQVIGLASLPRLDPWTASSAGLGHLLAQFQERELWVGLGGSATVEGGAHWPDLHFASAKVFCDVRTDLTECVRLFAPQKGARPEDLPGLEARLLALDLPRGPRTGAAGGLGARLLASGAELLDGASAILDALHFEDLCQGVEAVLTGEGRLDASTLEGKLPLVVAQRARSLGLPVIGHFGCRGPGWQRAAAAFDEVVFELP